MTRLIQRCALIGVVLASLVTAACSPMKEPAEAAIADANGAIQKLREDGPKYAPAEYAAASEDVAKMKAAYERKEYENVLGTVRDLIPKMRVLGETVAEKKRQESIALRDQWSGMTRALPASITAVEARAADLAKSHRLPKGVSKDSVAGAADAVTAVKQAWSEAQSAKSSGNVADAVAKGKAVQEKLGNLMASLGMGGAAAK